MRMTMTSRASGGFFDLQKSRRLASVLLLVGSGLAVAGCTPVGLVVGAGAATGAVALEERGFEQGARDRVTEASISKKMLDKDFDIFSKVSVEVVADRVLLTGIVPTEEARVEAVRTAWQEEGVVDVLNEVLVGDAAALDDTGQDLKIAADFRTKITLDKQIKAVNYSAEVVNGTVFLFGIAQNEAELRRVVAHTREIAHVRRIVPDYVLMKEDLDESKSG